MMELVRNATSDLDRDLNADGHNEHERATKTENDNPEPALSTSMKDNAPTRDIFVKMVNDLKKDCRSWNGPWYPLTVEHASSNSLHRRNTM